MDICNFSPPKFRMFSLREKTRLEGLYKRLGPKWDKIARSFPGRTKLEVKSYWLKKCSLERSLEKFLKHDLCAKNIGTRIVIKPKTDRRDREDERQTWSFTQLFTKLDILAMVCSNEFEK